MKYRVWVKEYVPKWEYIIVDADSADAAIQKARDGDDKGEPRLLDEVWQFAEEVK